MLNRLFFELLRVFWGRRGLLGKKLFEFYMFRTENKCNIVAYINFLSILFLKKYKDEIQQECIPTNFRNKK
jgi:hypothetical protein